MKALGVPPSFFASAIAASGGEGAIATELVTGQRTVSQWGGPVRPINMSDALAAVEDVRDVDVSDFLLAISDRLRFDCDNDSEELRARQAEKNRLEGLCADWMRRASQARAAALLACTACYKYPYHVTCATCATLSLAVYAAEHGANRRCAEARRYQVYPF